MNVQKTFYFQLKKMPKDIKFYKKQLAQKEEQIDILAKIAETISYNWDLSQIFSAIIDIVISYFDSDSCFIYLAEDKELVLKASQNPHQEKLGKIRMKWGEGITGWVARNKETVAINSKAYRDERYKIFKNLPEDKFEAFLSVPIIFKKNIVGVINVQHTKSRRYSKDKIELLEIIAKQVGGAIENARLLSETDLLKEALETRKLIDKAKAIIIKKHNLSEEEAHKFLHKKAMDSRKSLKEVAEAVILVG